MDLFSLQYLLFICILLILYYLLPCLARRSEWFSRVCRYQWVILLAASLGMYLYLSGRAFLLILTTAFTVWGGGLLLSQLEETYQIYRRDKSHSRSDRKAYKATVTKRKRVVLVLDLVLNFGILAFLKYFAPLLSAVSSSAFAKLALPLGISFYTFQAVSYLIDQYNGKYPAERNPLKFLLFVSWFPQLLQGPIGRFDQLGRQLTAEHHYDDEQRSRSGEALLLILYGLMKKYAIADMLVTSIADILDGTDIGSLPGSLIVFAILLYSAQQYADFSGGIDIVRGVSSLFGIKLARNFRQPYFSTSLGDFWRRWHISLGAWMRDYLFYPFALLKPMQRFGKWCTKHFGRQGKHLGRVLPAGIANIVVFLVVGIWHGPQMHYVLWGLYNGIVIALSDLTEPFWKGLNTRLHIPADSRGFHVIRIIRTFIIVNIGWYFDRIYNSAAVLPAFRQTFAHFEAGRLTDGIRSQVLTKSTAFNVVGGWSLAVLGLIIVFIVSFVDETNQEYHDQSAAGANGYQFENPAAARFVKHPFAIQILMLLIMVTMIFASFLFTETAGGFLYANF